MTATPISNDVQVDVEPSIAVPPKKSGMKPELSSWNSVGKRPDRLAVQQRQRRPLKTSMPASVTMKAGILK